MLGCQSAYLKGDVRHIVGEEDEGAQRKHLGVIAQGEQGHGHPMVHQGLEEVLQLTNTVDQLQPLTAPPVPFS